MLIHKTSIIEDSTIEYRLSEYEPENKHRRMADFFFNENPLSQTFKTIKGKLSRLLVL